MTRFFAVGFLLTVTLSYAVRAQATTEKMPAKSPASYGLVVDNSGSFRPLLDRVIAVVSDIVEGNGADDEAFLVTFVDTPKIVLRQEFTSRKSDLHDAAQNMFIEGGQTAILDAVKSSADYLARNARTEGSPLRSLVLVTDGEDRSSGSKADEVIRQLKEQNIRVFVIAIADGKVVTKLIDRLTKETAGRKWTPRTRAELTATAEEVSIAIRAQ